MNRLVLFLVLISVSFVAGVVVYFQIQSKFLGQFLKTNSSKRLTAISTKFVCQPQSITKSNGDVYTNNILGFSIEPPVNWSISVECSSKDSTTVTIEAPDSKEVVSPGSIPPHYIVRRFEIYISQREKTLTEKELEEEIKNRLGYNPLVTKIDPIKIDSRNAFRVTGLAFSGITDVYLSHNKRVYTIYHLEFVEGTSIDSPKYTKEFGQLLSSFKLID